MGSEKTSGAGHWEGATARLGLFFGSFPSVLRTQDSARVRARLALEERLDEDAEGHRRARGVRARDQRVQRREERREGHLRRTAPCGVGWCLV